MKHLKKLSVVLMLTALFSVTFTSCIDNEVSPVVEAIYAAQADLIAAQAGVQNAEAAYLLAQANAEQAQADYTAAQTAQVEVETAGMSADNAYAAAQREQYLLSLVATTNTQVTEAENALALAQVQFDIDMAAAIATMEAAGAQLAVGYAYDYRYAMQAANSILSSKISAEKDLANAMLLQQTPGSVSYAYWLSQLEGAVTSAMANKTNLETAIADLEAYMADPTTTEAIISGLKAQNLAYHDAMDAKEIEMQVQFNKIMAIIDESGVRNELVDRYDDAKSDLDNAILEKTNRETLISDAQDDVADWQLALNDYPTALATLELALSNAETAYDNAWTALGLTDGAGTDILFANYFMVDAAGGAIGAGATKYATPANLQEVYVNARIDYLDADDALTIYQNDFSALVTSYNLAANNLNAAQIAFDAADYAGALTTAQTAVTTSLAVGGDYKNAYDAYDDAKNAFEGDPSGFTTTDGPGLHLADNFDFGNTGITGDGFTRTFMRVGSVGEVTPGSGTYEVKSLLPTKYIYSQLAGVATGLSVANTDAFIWEDVVGGMPITDLAGTVYAPDVHTKNLETTPGGVGFVSAIDGGTRILFVEVEADDSSVSKLFTFNVATNMLGTNNFSGRAFFTGGTGVVGDPYTFEAPLIFTDLDAGYDNTWDGNTSIPQVDNTLTAEAALWNLKLAEFIAQNNFDLGDDLLAAAQDAFDYQKELFDHGVANLAILQGAADAAETARDNAEADVDDAWKALGDEIAEGLAGDAKVTLASVSPRTFLTLNEVFYNAEITLADFLVCDDVCLQGKIDQALEDIANWTAEIAAIQPIIDAKQVVLDSLQTDYDDYMANAGVLSGLYADLHAEIIAEWQIYWIMDQELNAIQDAHDLNIALISAYGWATDDLADLAVVLSDLQDQLVAADGTIDAAEQALAAGQVEADAAEANITYLQGLVDTLEQRYANALAIAAKYKALMDAALAS